MRTGKERREKELRRLNRRGEKILPLFSGIKERCPGKDNGKTGKPS